ncbi:MAG: hypothetical protein EXX96DRAFT_479671 [Benjaminiella poitrasii]|nr:MAG: hypothetical protein EXX96DRAFT_479671 [Benjaminiella poitrasii]
MLQPSDVPDLSNPYIYPANPINTVNNDENHSLQNNISEDPYATFTEVSSGDKKDPELSKLKSSFWKRAGQFQSAIGSLTGSETWQFSGKKTEQEADREYQEAQDRIIRGEPSRMHGEYDRLMGYLNYAIGHIAGDREIQAKAAERTEQGLAEINRSVNRP